LNRREQREQRPSGSAPFFSVAAVASCKRSACIRVPATLTAGKHSRLTGRIEHPPSSDYGAAGEYEEEYEYYERGVG